MKTMTKTEPEAPRLSAQDAEVALAAARAELAQLEQRAAGAIEHQTMRREQHTVVRRTGFVETVAVDVPHLETEHVGALGRLRARRALTDAKDRVALAEEQLEEVRLAAASRARTQRAEAIRAGEAIVRRELPALITELRAAQQHMQAFAERMTALDAPLGGHPYFQEASFVPLLPQRELDFWVEHVRAMFGLPE